jgi:hypothetical protein
MRLDIAPGPLASSPHGLEPQMKNKVAPLDNEKGPLFARLPLQRVTFYIVMITSFEAFSQVLYESRDPLLLGAWDYRNIHQTRASEVRGVTLSNPLIFITRTTLWWI